MIQNEEKTTISGWRGRVTSNNHAGVSPTALMKAKNVLLSDGGVQRMPGYTLFANVAASIKRIFGYERQSDRKQFILVCAGGNLKILNTAGALVRTIAYAGSDDFDFVGTKFSGYLANGSNPLTLVNEGLEQLRQAGIDAPPTAPTLTFPAGTLTLRFGRRYVFCYVAQWTDSQGVLRYHIGLPSDFSAHTGPQTAKNPTLGGLTASVNPRVTHKWIFATEDSEDNTSATYSFVAEITNATTSFADTVIDDDLDSTRLAPFDNFPWPANAAMLVEYENRIAIIADDTVQLTGNEEIELGIRQETCPAALAFTLPSGVKKITGAVNFKQALMLGTPEGWTQLRGYDAETFQKRDNIITPGPAGRKAVLVFAGFLFYVSRDANAWAWDGASEIALPLTGALLADGDVDEMGMADIDPDQIANVELQMYSSGNLKILVMACSTDNSDVKNWLQAWDVTPVLAGKVPAETDFVPAHAIQTTAIVQMGGIPWLLMGDAAGNVYRWPDGEVFHDNEITSVIETPWLTFKFDGMKRMLWIDLFTDREDAKNGFKLYAAASQAATKHPVFTEVPLEDAFIDGVVDPVLARGNLRVEGLARAVYMKFRIVFPSDENPSSLNKLIVHTIPLTGVRT